jgi:hypothetical protein
VTVASCVDFLNMAFKYDLKEPKTVGRKLFCSNQKQI